MTRPVEFGSGANSIGTNSVSRMRSRKFSSRRRQSATHRMERKKSVQKEDESIKYSSSIDLRLLAGSLEEDAGSQFTVKVDRIEPYLKKFVTQVQASQYEFESSSVARDDQVSSQISLQRRHASAMP